MSATRYSSWGSSESKARTRSRRAPNNDPRFQVEETTTNRRSSTFRASRYRSRRPPAASIRSKAGSPTTTPRPRAAGSTRWRRSSCSRCEYRNRAAMGSPSWRSSLGSSPEALANEPGAVPTRRLCPTPCGMSTSGAGTRCGSPLALAANARSCGVRRASSQGRTSSTPAARSRDSIPDSEAEPGVTVKVTPTRSSASSEVTSSSRPAAGTLRTTARTSRLGERVAHSGARRFTLRFSELSGSPVRFVPVRQVSLRELRSGRAIDPGHRLQVRQRPYTRPRTTTVLRRMAQGGASRPRRRAVARDRTPATTLVRRGSPTAPRRPRIRGRR